MSRKKFQGKGNPKSEQKKILELFKYIANDVKILFQDEVKFFSRQLGNKMWANRRLFNELEKDLKDATIEKREVIVCYSIDGLHGLVQIDGACTNQEYKYLIENMLLKADLIDDGKPFVIFQDCAACCGITLQKKKL